MISVGLGHEMDDSDSQVPSPPLKKHKVQQSIGLCSSDDDEDDEQKRKRAPSSMEDQIEKELNMYWTLKLSKSEKYDFDILSWWKSKTEKGHLPIMARAPDPYSAFLRQVQCQNAISLMREIPLPSKGINWLHPE